MRTQTRHIAAGLIAASALIPSAAFAADAAPPKPASAQPESADSGGKAEKLRREGEFLANQHVRLKRAPNSSSLLVAFESDPQGTPPPMAVLPGQLLQNMETLVQERGDQTLFVISGQVTTYRGSNYLLPTSTVVWSPPRNDAPPATAPAPMPGKNASADQVLQQMGSMIERNAAIESAPRVVTTPPATKVMDPAVLGPAPGERATTLRREGEFVVERRGRLVHGTGNSTVMFAFDADARTSPEPPMVLIPCQLLQSMENLSQERGDRVVFVLTGQVFTYRGANYLLPTTMKLAIDKGNLKK
ncbi:MAG: hypothetical protein NTW19_07365 [Planctomycetota bacterium]|nr:hypothetical protein [Planctomycetota bacterium]